MFVHAVALANSYRFFRFGRNDIVTNYGQI
jgi:hypothetical protein